MTRAVLLALLAGAPAALGIANLVTGARRANAGNLGGRRGARVRALLLRVGRRIGAPSPPGDLAARLDAAGARLAVADAMALKAGGALAGALVLAPVAAGAPGRLGSAVPLAGAAAGFLALDLGLLRRARARAAAMTLELPSVLDLLRVGLQAGLPTDRALAEVGRRHGGTLGDELARAAARAAVGVPRREALAHLRRRAPIEGVAALATILERADRLGAPPAEALGAVAREAREARARARAEAAARAAPKIQLVVALLLVPAVLLLVAAALAPALLRSV